MIMKLYIENHKFHYEMENVVRLFFHNEKVEVVKEFEELISPYILTKTYQKDNDLIVIVTVNFKNFNKTKQKIIKDYLKVDFNEQERIMAILLYELLLEYTKIKPSWGIVTGVRPVKLYRSLINEGGKTFAKEFFEDKYLVSKEKTKLTIDTETNESKILELSQKKSFSLYVSIPFCPSRCTYCSFVSQSIEKSQNLIAPYFKKLCEEIIYTASIVAKLDLKLESIYIGGGTPTTLFHTMLTELIRIINDNFDVKNCREFTIEAGRPDTITEEKLIAIYNGAVDRISINPQTLNDDILKSIGRKHTSKEAISAFELARKIGFKHINTDLIIGLPNEGLESFKNTLDIITDLKPESITIHTLSMKKTSTLNKENVLIYKNDAIIAENMHNYANIVLPKCDYQPYYLYRQSKMVGNLENVGWSVAGKEGIYNVYVMDETHTIIGCGACAVTKLKEPNGKYLERIFNYKLPYEYINDFDEMINRKKKIVEFYRKFG